MPTNPNATSINTLLPQTQCTRCGYQGCLPYAEAIAEGAPINQCPPGGQLLIDRLAGLLGRPVIALNPENGVEAPRRLAWIDEAECIGCTKCIQVCPTDAIVGASKLMHTVIHAECVSCALCIPACPVDCITMELDHLGAAGGARRLMTSAESAAARLRYQARDTRLAALAADKAAAQAQKLRLLRPNLVS